MTTSMQSETNVLIAGAGPTGLTLAIVLRRYGIAVRIIEKAPEFSIGSRGKGVQPRSLEVFDDLGVIDAILASGQTGAQVRIYNHGKLVADLGMLNRAHKLPGIPYPGVVFIPEWRTEAILRQRLMTLGVSVERGRELVTFEDTRAGVIARVRDVVTNVVEPIRAGYLVGADGGRSIVRKQLGLRFEGETKEQHFVLGDMEIEGLEPQDAGHAWLHNDGLLAAGPLPHTSTWQVLAEVRPNAAGEVEPASLELFGRLFAERAGRSDVRLSNATWLSNYRVNQRLVDRYRVGRVFVAGDAAHVHSPAGGQGMNTGVQDAYNLGWKLALVVQGKAADGLLDTYAAERIPIARAVLQRSGTGHSVVFSANPAISFVRERMLLPIVQLPIVSDAVARKMAQLDVNYRCSPLARSEELRLKHATLLPTHGGEQASLDDWLRFQRAVQAGDRAPDARGRDGRMGTPMRLFDLFRGPHFTLLLFAGKARTDGGYARLAAIAGEVTERFGDDVRPCVVVVGETHLASLEWKEAVLLDTEGEAHRLYGVGAEGLYLIRPDGYIGFRSRRVLVEPLLAYLDQQLVSPVLYAR